MSQTNLLSEPLSIPVGAAFHPSRSHFLSQSTPLSIPVGAAFHPSRSHFSSQSEPLFS